MFEFNEQPSGWLLGRLPDIKYYNNGIINKRYYPDEQPEGWSKGRIKKEKLIK